MTPDGDGSAPEPVAWTFSSQNAETSNAEEVLNETTPIALGYVPDSSFDHSGVWQADADA
jgi:hypothetical protein